MHMVVKCGGLDRLIFLIQGPLFAVKRIIPADELSKRVNTFPCVGIHPTDKFPLNFNFQKKKKKS